MSQYEGRHYRYIEKNTGKCAVVALLANYFLSNETGWKGRSD